VTVARALVPMLLLALARAAAAQTASPASELPIEWQAPESCPDRQALIRRLGALLGEAPRDLGTLSGVRAVVQETRTGKQLTLEVEESGQHSTREFQARDCVDLVDAAALAIGLALHDGPGRQPAASPPPSSADAPAIELDARPPTPEPEPRRLGWSLGAEAALDSGALPELAPGVGAQARLLFGGWSVDAHGLFLPGQRVAEYLGLPPSQLDDGAQELWVVVHRRYAQFEGRSDIRSWLFAIAVNVERNFRRAERRRGPLVALPSELHARHGDPALDHEAREAWGLMLGFVETLDETRRTVFVASLLEGLSAAETAEVTGLDETTVYNRVRALRRSFQLWIKQHRSEP